MKTIFLAGVFAVGLLAAPAARADLAPPKGVKRVGYAFTAHVTGDTANQVVFAYPCSGSNGAPGRKISTLGAADSVTVGNHESCKVYVVAKSAYDTWSKSGPSPDPDALASQAKVCDGTAPTPIHDLPTEDPRASVVDDVDVKVTSGACSISVRTAAATTPTGTTAPPAEKKNGCNASGSSSFPLLLALPALVLLLKKRRAS